jgi:hypothetical protein
MCGCAGGAATPASEYDKIELRESRGNAMRAILGMLFVSFFAAAAFAQQPMKPTAPAKMMSERDQKKMKECEAKAAAQNVPMNQRSKFVMTCMTAEPPPY